MVSNYRKNPRTAVEDYKILVASVWKDLGIVLSLPDTQRSLAGMINSDDESCQPQADANDEIDLKSELDFRQLNKLSPVDSIRRFREVIEFCCKDAELFSRVGLDDLDQLFERMVNRTSNDDWALHESIRAVERNLKRFETGVEVEQYKAPPDPGGGTTAVQPEGANPNEPGSDGGTLKLLRDKDPEAAPYRDGSQWCDVRYARTLGISSKHIDRARKHGCYEIRLTNRRKADVNGKPYVYLRAELNELSEAIPDEFKVEPN